MVNPPGRCNSETGCTPQKTSWMELDGKCGDNQGTDIVQSRVYKNANGEPAYMKGGFVACNAGSSRTSESPDCELRYTRGDTGFPTFTLPAIVLVILTILNDGTIISISYDYVVPANIPQKWAAGRMLTSVLILGLLSLAMLLVGYSIVSVVPLTPIEIRSTLITFRRIRCYL